MPEFHCYLQVHVLLRHVVYRVTIAHCDSQNFLLFSSQMDWLDIASHMDLVVGRSKQTLYAYILLKLACLEP